jgi:DNA repair protein SbcC/Rad50
VILRSLRVQGWRCFANPVFVGPFADGLNVLHAANATGKSTLFEALLRGLLDGHRVSGREVENLRPWGRGLSPAVTVEFAHGGVDYRLTKQFLDRPSAELERREDGCWVRLADGEAADERVRELLTRNPPGRGLARPEHWGLAQVLWAPQGDLTVPKLSGDLVADIRTALGAQVSGPGSGPLEARIAAAYLRCYTPGGQFKRGKDAPPVVRLRQNLEEARTAQRVAREQQHLFEETARQLEDLHARRAHAKRDAEELTRALRAARAQVETYKALRSEKAQRAERAKAAEAQHGELQQRIEAITAAARELRAAREDLARRESELPALAREVEAREREMARTKAQVEDVRKTRDVIEATAQRAALARRYLEYVDRAAALDDRLRRIATATVTRGHYQHLRCRLVAPDAKQLRAIRNAMKERDDARIRFEAALITLEIVPAQQGEAVVIAGEQTGTRPLAAGVPARIAGSPEVVVDLPGVARLRARGPAGSIAEVRSEHDRAVRRLQALTEGFGTADVETLEALREQAMELDAQIAAAETQIDTLLAAETAERLEAARTSAAAMVMQLRASHPEWGDAPPDAEALRQTAESQRRAFLDTIDVAEAEREQAQAALNLVLEQRAAVAAQLEATQRQERSLAATLATLTHDGQPDAERHRALRRLALAWSAARAGLEEIEQQVADFGDDPSAVVATLEKQLQAAADTATTALEQEKSEEGRLTQLSMQGPYTALARAEEAVARLERETAADELRLAAIRLLHDTVEQCRRAAIAAVAGPVEAAATRTLQRIAGHRLGRVRLSDSFEPVHVEPGTAAAPVPLESMSGGEREQIALATRLALADVLAQGERQLVVLDDVLVATDAGRLARVMRVLEEAAQRLQLLILTCHPERYAGLDGTTFFDLERILCDSAAA